MFSHVDHNAIFSSLLFFAWHSVFFFPIFLCSAATKLSKMQTWAKAQEKRIRLTIKFNGNTLKAGGAKRLVNWPEFSPKNRVQRVQVQRFISVARTLDINCQSTYGQVPGGKISFYLYSCHTSSSFSCIFNLFLPYGRFACPICTVYGKELGLSFKGIL